MFLMASIKIWAFFNARTYLTHRLQVARDIISPNLCLSSKVCMPKSCNFLVCKWKWRWAHWHSLIHPIPLTLDFLVKLSISIMPSKEQSCYMSYFNYEMSWNVLNCKHSQSKFGIEKMVIKLNAIWCVSLLEAPNLFVNICTQLSIEWMCKYIRDS